jgi:hypothetical protein
MERVRNVPNQISSRRSPAEFSHCPTADPRTGFARRHHLRDRSLSGHLIVGRPPVSKWSRGQDQGKRAAPRGSHGRSAARQVEIEIIETHCISHFTSPRNSIKISKTRDRRRQPPPRCFKGRRVILPILMHSLEMESS